MIIYLKRVCSKSKPLLTIIKEKLIFVNTLTKLANNLTIVGKNS